MEANKAFLIVKQLLIGIKYVLCVLGQVALLFEKL